MDALLINLSRTGRGAKQLVAIGTDSALSAACLWLAYTWRHGEPFSDFQSTWYLFSLVPVVTVFVFAGFGIYRWVVRSSNFRLYTQIAKACAVSAATLLLLIYLFPPERANPRSLFVVYGLLLFVSACTVRFAWRARFDAAHRGEPLAVFGAGPSGQRVVNLLSSSHEHRPVVLIDDDPAYGGRTVEGLPVIDAGAEGLRQRLARFDVSKIVIAPESLSGELLRDRLSMLESLGLEIKTMPTVADLVAGTAAPNQIRDLSIADLLGRSEVLPDRMLMGQRVTGRTVLVTGGAGSIGSELARQILQLSPLKLLVLDNNEAALYAIGEELDAFSGPQGRPAGAFVPVLGSVRDRSTLDRLFAVHGVETVFHAAAYKHVPIIENRPGEGVETNVFGTLNLVDAAVAAGVKDLVLISTDKAVRPTNAMGASKRVAELILQAKTLEQSTTRLSMVRFGNVLGSSGSVVPKFQRQIKDGGPITLTDRRITRYFMSISEATQLVLQASAIARGGDVFVLDMGEPVKILDLANSMIRLSGKRLAEETGDSDDIRVVVEGLRPGEKLYEELFIDADSHRETAVSKIFTAGEALFSWSDLVPRLDTLRRLVDDDDAAGLRAELLHLAGGNERSPRRVPEGRSAASGSVAHVDSDDGHADPCIGDEDVPTKEAARDGQASSAMAARAPRRQTRMKMQRPADVG